MNSDIAREVTARIATHQRVKSAGWSWQRGVVLFPEARCPYCKQVIKSKAIWVVRDNYLIGQAVPVAGKPLVLDPPRHPHATPSAICMGDATDPLQALFHGLNPDSVWINIIEWLQGKYWEHACAEMDRQFYCAGCDNEYRESTDLYRVDDGYYCEDCFNEDYFICTDCRESFSQSEEHNVEDDRYCYGCFTREWVYCYKCGKAVALGSEYSALDESYCESCFDAEFSYCSDCGTASKTDDLREYNDLQLCSDCYDPASCEECSDEFREQDNTYCIYCIKNLCPYCAENHASCGEGA